MACMLTAQCCNLIYHPSFKPIQREPISLQCQAWRSKPGTCVWKDRRKVNDLRSLFRECGIQVSKLRGIAALGETFCFRLLYGTWWMFILDHNHFTFSHRAKWLIFGSLRGSLVRENQWSWTIISGLRLLLRGNSQASIFTKELQFQNGC